MSITCSLMRQCVVNVVKSSNFQTITSTYTYPPARYPEVKKSVRGIPNVITQSRKIKSSAKGTISKCILYFRRVMFDCNITVYRQYSVRGSVLLLFPAETRNDEVKRANLHVI
jgi:hypothetical protein